MLKKILSLIFILNLCFAKEEMKKKRSGFLGFINFITKRIPIIGFSLDNPIDVSDKLLKVTLGEIQEIADQNSQNKHPLDDYLDNLHNNENDFQVLKSPGFDLYVENKIPRLLIDPGSIFFGEVKIGLDFSDNSTTPQTPNQGTSPHIRIQPKTLVLVEMEGNALTIEFAMVEGKEKGLTKALKGLNITKRKKCLDNLDYCLATSRESFPELVVGDLLNPKKPAKTPKPKINDSNLVRKETASDLEELNNELSKADTECKKLDAGSFNNHNRPTDIFSLLNQLFKAVTGFIVSDLVDFLAQPKINIKKIKIPDIKNLSNQYMEVELIISAQHLKLTVVRPNILLCLGEIFKSSR